MAHSRFSEPMGLAVLSASVLLIADRGNDRVRALLWDQQMVVTLVGQGAVELLQTADGAVPGVLLGSAPNVQISRPTGLALMHDGSGVFISEATRVLFFSFVTGDVSVVAGLGALPGATSPALKTPAGLAWSSTLGLFIADAGTNQVRRKTHELISSHLPSPLLLLLRWLHSAPQVSSAFSGLLSNPSMHCHLTTSALICLAPARRSSSSAPSLTH
jgi:hypothetical protein